MIATPTSFLHARCHDLLVHYPPPPLQTWREKPFRFLPNGMHMQIRLVPIIPRACFTEISSPTTHAYWKAEDKASCSIFFVSLHSSPFLIHLILSFPNGAQKDECNKLFPIRRPAASRIYCTSGNAMSSPTRVRPHLDKTTP